MTSMGMGVPDWTMCHSSYAARKPKHLCRVVAVGPAMTVANTPHGFEDNKSSPLWIWRLPWSFRSLGRPRARLLLASRVLTSWHESIHCDGPISVHTLSLLSSACTICVQVGLTSKLATWLAALHSADIVPCLHYVNKSC